MADRPWSMARLWQHVRGAADAGAPRLREELLLLVEGDALLEADAILTVEVSPLVGVKT